MLPRFWIMQDHKLEGPYDLETVTKLPGFTPTTLLCREGEDVWQPASQALKIRPQPIKFTPRLAGSSSIAFEGEDEPPVQTAPPLPEAIPVKTSAVAPSSASYVSGDYKSREPALTYPGPSRRVWFLFICLSIVNSVYWMGSRHFAGGLQITLPVPVDYIPPVSPARHSVKRLPDPVALLAPIAPAPELNKKPPFTKKGGRSKSLKIKKVSSER